MDAMKPTAQDIADFNKRFVLDRELVRAAPDADIDEFLTNIAKSIAKATPSAPPGTTHLVVTQNLITHTYLVQADSGEAAAANVVRTQRGETVPGVKDLGQIDTPLPMISHAAPDDVNDGEVIVSEVSQALHRAPQVAPEAYETLNAEIAASIRKAKGGNDEPPKHHKNMGGFFR